MPPYYGPRIGSRSMPYSERAYSMSHSDSEGYHSGDDVSRRPRDRFRSRRHRQDHHRSLSVASSFNPGMSRTPADTAPFTPVSSAYNSYNACNQDRLSSPAHYSRSEPRRGRRLSVSITRSYDSGITSRSRSRSRSGLYSPVSTCTFTSIANSAHPHRSGSYDPWDSHVLSHCGSFTSVNSFETSYIRHREDARSASIDRRRHRRGSTASIHSFENGYFPTHTRARSPSPHRGRYHHGLFSSIPVHAPSPPGYPIVNLSPTRSRSSLRDYFNAYYRSTSQDRRATHESSRAVRCNCGQNYVVDGEEPHRRRRRGMTHERRSRTHHQPRSEHSRR